MRLSREELREHERKLRRIEIQGERKLLEEELKQKREEYWPKKKPPNASKVALAYIFISCTAVQLTLWPQCGTLRISQRCTA